MAEIRIVEDEAPLRRSVAIQLRRGGHRVQEAAGALGDLAEHAAPQAHRARRVGALLGEELPGRRRGGDRHRDPSTMIAAPATQSDAPARSHRVGTWRSAIQSQSIAVVM